MQNFLFTSDIFKGSRYEKGHPLDMDRVWPSVELIQLMGWVKQKQIIKNKPAGIEELAKFHDINYVKALIKAETDQSLSESLKIKFNIGIGNNPIFKEVFSRPASAVKASIEAVEMIATQKANKILNISGGTHHGRKSQAYGFCFLNDCVLGILKAIELGFSKILYVDLDAHHCDGVQDVFVNNDKVTVISIHEENRWPKTGTIDDCKINNIMNFKYKIIRNIFSVKLCNMLIKKTETSIKKQKIKLDKLKTGKNFYGELMNPFIYDSKFYELLLNKTIHKELRKILGNNYQLNMFAILKKNPGEILRNDKMHIDGKKELKSLKKTLQLN